MFGVIKETGVDDEGLAEFHDKHFPFPLFRDERKRFYRAFGSGSFYDGMSWNPFTLWSGYQNLKARLKEKELKGNLKGDGLRTGGLVVFDAAGEMQYMYKEQTGVPIDEKVFLEAVAAVRQSNPMSSVPSKM